jgi:mono/diheme cytochrome c family protein
VRALRIAVLVACSACSDPRLGSADGKTLFEAVCARCHGFDGRGDPVEKARLGVPDMTDPRWQLARRDEDIQRTIIEGSKSKKMPAFGKTAFRPDQLDALVRHVRALRNRRGGSPEGR